MEEKIAMPAEEMYKPLTKEELEEMEKLKNTPEVKAYNKARREYYKQRQKLYMLRWNYKQGARLIEEKENAVL